MRSIKTTVTATAILTAGFVLTAPAAHAATTNDSWHGGHGDKNACHMAIRDAQKARHDLEEAEKQIADDGHRGTDEAQNVDDLKDAAKAAVEDAIEACKDMDHHHMRRHPHGAMHAGVGSTSQGVNGGELAGGMGFLGAAGAGALALRRRRAGSES